MEMATVAHQSLLSRAHLQALGTDPMLYQSSWQPVVGNVLPVTEAPTKESIIANTDFTLVSIISKRRLSSRRRKLNMESSSKDRSSMENSCTSSSNSSTSSPSNNSCVCTPPSEERRDMDVAPPRGGESSGLALSKSRVPSCLDASQVPYNLSMAAGSSSALENIVSKGSAPGYVAATAAEVPSSSHHMAVIQSQHMANTGLHQYIHGVDPRYAQEQSQSSKLEIRGPNGFKWCTAHVAIAKQIQMHKQGKQEASFFGQPHQASSPPQAIHQATLPSQQPPNTSTLIPTPPLRLFTPPQQQQQQQQQQSSTTATTSSTHHQLALMQYSLPANTIVATGTAAAAAGCPPSYVAMPYPSMQELQMRMQQQQQGPPPPMIPIPAAAPQLQIGGAGGIQIMKPVMALPDNNVVSVNLGLQMIGGGFHPSTLQQAHIPGLTTGGPHFAPASSTGVIPGPGVWGVAPIQGVNSCVFEHSIQPGLMAAPWVK